MIYGFAVLQVCLLHVIRVIEDSEVAEVGYRRLHIRQLATFSKLLKSKSWPYITNYHILPVNSHICSRGQGALFYLLAQILFAYSILRRTLVLYVSVMTIQCLFFFSILTTSSHA